MRPVDIAHVILVVATLAGASVYFKFLGRRELIWPAFLQAFRWVAAGLVLAVAAEAYLDADYFSVQMFWMVAAIVVLGWIEHELLRVDDMTDS